MRLQDMTFDLDKARVDAAYVGNICLTYEEWPETDNDMQYILAAVYDLEPALDEIERQAARIKELEAEVEAKNKQIKELQDIIDKPPEEAQWMTDYHLLRSAMDGTIIESARRWHGAFRKAQNSNLIRLQQNARLGAEVERLRSENEALNEKLIEAKAKEIYPFNIPHWDNLPEEDTVGKLCPTVTRRGKAYWRKEATRQLAEEMPEVDWQ